MAKVEFPDALAAMPPKTSFTFRTKSDGEVQVMAGKRMMASGEGNPIWIGITHCMWLRYETYGLQKFRCNREPNKAIFPFSYVHEEIAPPTRPMRAFVLFVFLYCGKMNQMAEFGHNTAIPNLEIALKSIQEKTAEAKRLEDQVKSRRRKACEKAEQPHSIRLKSKKEHEIKEASKVKPESEVKPDPGFTKDTKLEASDKQKELMIDEKLSTKVESKSKQGPELILEPMVKEKYDGNVSSTTHGSVKKSPSLSHKQGFPHSNAINTALKSQTTSSSSKKRSFVQTEDTDGSGGTFLGCG